MIKKYLRICWVILLLMVWQGPAWADELAASASAASAVMGEESGAEQSFPVVVGDRTIATFRVGILGFSAKDRYEAAVLRVERILKEAKVGLVTTKPNPPPVNGVGIYLDQHLLFTLQEGDAQVLTGETLDKVVAQAVQMLKIVYAEQRERRDPKQLLKSVALSVLASLIFGAGLWLCSRSRVIFLKLGRRYITLPIARIAKKTTGVKLSLLNQTLHWIINLLISMLGLSLLYSWASFVFAQFPLTRVWSENLNEVIFRFVSEVSLAILHAIPGLLVMIFIIACARYVSRFIHFAFNRIERGELHLNWFDRDTASTTRRILSFLVWLLAAAMIYPYLPGANTDAFKGLSVMVGLMVSLGASSVVGQFASGLILIYAKSLKNGEYVQIGSVEGTVAHIGLFATKIHTNLREEVSIPNSVLVGQNVINFSRLAVGSGVISQVIITIGYDVAWRQVEAMLLEAAKDTEGVRRNPAPRVFQTALSDWYVEYHLRVALDEPRRRLEILNDLHGKVQDVFNTYGVQIMSPNYRADPEIEKLVPVDQWYPAPAKREGPEPQKAAMKGQPPLSKTKVVQSEEVVQQGDVIEPGDELVKGDEVVQHGDVIQPGDETQSTDVAKK